tara:strand:- start:1369 stop:1890 length:522 start_codon:yes stop_codon:yes gene_type:complete
MANAASITVKATLLPSEISKLLDDITVTYTPSDSTEGWYYKLTNVTTSSLDLIEQGTAGYVGKGSTPTGVDAGGTSSLVASGDKVKFLFIKHLGVRDDGSTLNTADSIYLVLDAAAAAHNAVDAIEVGPNECWFGKMNGTTVADIHAISGQKAGAGTGGNKIQCIVAAILDDV